MRRGRQLLQAALRSGWPALRNSLHPECRVADWLPGASAALHLASLGSGRDAGGSSLGWAAGALAASVAVAMGGRRDLEASCDADSSSLAAAKDAMKVAWREVGSQQWGATPPRGEPKVMLVDGRLSVRFPLRRGADLSAVVVELVCRLTGQGAGSGVRDGEMSVKVAECGVARVLSFETTKGGPDGKPQGVCAQLFVPMYGNDLPEVEFQKAGALSGEDMEVISAVLRTANAPQSEWAMSRDAGGLEGRLRGRPWEGLEELEAMLGGLFERGMAGALDGGYEEMEAAMRELFGEEGVRGFGIRVEGRRTPREGSPWQSQPEEGERDGEQEVERWRSGRGVGGGRGVAVEQVPDSKERVVQQLEKMGAKVYRANPKNKVDWGLLAGYEEQKRRIEDGLLLPLLHPEVYDDVAKGTRKHFASNRPRGVLFEGPPGTGKTTSARVIASQAAVPLVYIPLEAVVSKWYGESERLLAQAFKAADDLGGAIIFLDEIETLAVSRGSDTNEATRRLLGVLLREMDGFDTSKKTVVIAATNRKQDVDTALLSRFDATLRFGLPDEACRGLIVEQYARHLDREEVAALAAASGGMSGRDLRDVCEQAERVWASRIVRGEAVGGALPTIGVYMEACEERRRGLE